MTTTTSQAVERSTQGPGALVKQYERDFTLVLPSHIKPEQWVRMAQGLLRRDPKLYKAANANPGAFLQAMLRCAHLGLDPGDTFHVVPFGNDIVGITDYKGEIELMYRAGAVDSVVADTVHRNDTFIWTPGRLDTQDPPRWPGPMTRPFHEADHFGDRGDLMGAYAYALMTTGAVSRVVVMGKAEILKHKAVSRSSGGASSPWQKWPGSMYLKTVVHELRKWVPTSPEYRQELLRSQAAIEDISPDLAGALPEPNTVTGADDDQVIDAEFVDEPTYADDDPERPFE